MTEDNRAVRAPRVLITQDHDHLVVAAVAVIVHELYDAEIEDLRQYVQREIEIAIERWDQ
jgi:hypothetical protein